MVVEFVVRVPPQTPPDHAVYLAGAAEPLGEWAAAGRPLERQADGSWRGWAEVPPGTPYLITLGRWRTVESDGPGRERPPRLVPSQAAVLDVTVTGWGRDSVRYHPDFRSRFLPHARTLAVWRPPGYDLDPARRYSVFYLHDGQNLFDAETAFAGTPWGADETAEREVRAGRVAPVLLVGVANTPDRLREYGAGRAADAEPAGAADLSRAYARFLVEEVKPFVDAHYRTLQGPDHTGVGGSSLGGLISLYLCRWYPEVFGRCAALSPSLWWDREEFGRQLDQGSPWPTGCRLWLDMGTREGETAEAAAAQIARAHRLADALRRSGLSGGDRFHYEDVTDGEHNEAAWGRRFDRVLRFLFPADGSG